MQNEEGVVTELYIPRKWYIGFVIILYWLFWFKFS